MSYKHSLDFLVWSHSYLEYAYKAAPFFPKEFEAAATAILNHMGMTQQDITTDNARGVYYHLCSIMTP